MANKSAICRKTIANDRAKHAAVVAIVTGSCAPATAAVDLLNVDGSMKTNEFDATRKPETKLFLFTYIYNHLCMLLQLFYYCMAP